MDIELVNQPSAHYYDKLERPIRSFKPPTISRTVLPSDVFVDLCNKHIMNSDVSLNHKHHLHFGNQNIYILGEYDALFNPRCKPTFKMFTDLINEIKPYGYVDVDVMVGVTKQNVLDVTWEQQRGNSIDDYAMYNAEKVFMFFNECILSKECIFRVHWINPNGSTIPEWITDLQSYHTAWKNYKGEFIDELESVEKNKFALKNRLFKIITENPVVMKEIGKVDSFPFDLKQFFLQFVFTRLGVDMPLKKIVYLTLHLSTALYTLSRILKSNMTNVIVSMHNDTAYIMVHLFREIPAYKVESKWKRCELYNSYFLPISIEPIVNVFPQNTDTLGIYLSTHAEVNVDKDGHAIILKNDTGVIINKSSEAPFGYVSFCSETLNDQTISSEIEKTLFNFNMCSSSDQFIRKIRFVDNSDLSLVDTKNMCQMFEQVTTLYEKLYKKINIIFAVVINKGSFMRKQINIAVCSEKDLHDFFTDYIDLYDIDINEVLRVCNEFIRYRNSKSFISTSSLLDLIHLSKEVFNIKTVNILDKACSVVQFHPNIDVSHNNGFAIGRKPTPGVAIGGKTRKYKSLKLKTYKLNQKNR